MLGIFRPNGDYNQNYASPTIFYLLNGQRKTPTNALKKHWMVEFLQVSLVPACTIWQMKPSLLEQVSTLTLIRFLWDSLMQREIITLSGAVSSWLGSNSEQNKSREI